MLRPFRSTTHFARLIAVALSIASCLLAVSSISPQTARAADPAWTSMPLTGDNEDGIIYSNDYDTSESRVVWSAGGQFMYPPEAYSTWDLEIYSWTEDEGTVRITQNDSDDESPVVSGDRVAWFFTPHSDAYLYGNFLDHCAIMTWTPTEGAVEIRTLQYGDDLTWRSHRAEPIIAGDRIAWCEWTEATGNQLFTWTPAGGVVQVTTDAEDLYIGDVRVSANRLFWTDTGGSDGGYDYELFTWSPSGGIVQLTQDDVSVDFDASGDRVAYIASDGDWGSFYADIWTWTPTGGHLRIAESQLIAEFGAIATSESRVVWQINNQTEPGYSLRSWTPSTPTQEIVPDDYNAYAPAISGDRVAFYGKAPDSLGDDDYEIFTWTPTTGIERVTDSNYRVGEPKVVGDQIVWTIQDIYDRGFNYAVYDLFVAYPYKPDVTPPTTLLTASHEANSGSGWILYPELTVTLDRKLREPGTTYYSYTSSGAGTVYSEPFTPLEGNRTLYYWSVDTAGNTEARKSWPYKFDTVAPTKPTNLRVTAVGSYSVTLAWNASTDATSGVSYYGIYMDGPFREEAPASATSWTVENLRPNTSYSFELCTFDVAGNYSGWTEDVTARTLSGTAVEGAPVANSDSYYTTEGTDLNVSAANGVLANDSDPNGLELTAIQVVTGDPLTDNVTLSSNGSFTYHAFPGFIGTDTFIYRAYNGTYYSEPTTVTITVGSASGNQPPVIATIGTKQATRGSLLQFQIVATDPDDDPLTYMLLDIPGDADISNSGVFSWTPTLTFPYDSYSVRVQVSDGRGGVTEQTFTILIGDTPRDLTTVPLEGAGRIETAVEVSKRGFTQSSHVIIATAFAFPDALGGSSLAGALNAPILLTSPTALPDVVRNEIVRLGASHIIILGGENAVNADVHNQLLAIPGMTVDRIWGDDRYSTAQAIAQSTIGVLGSAYDGTAFIATGANFPDALGASPIAAAKGWPIYLANPYQGDNSMLIDNMRSHGVTDALILGGPVVVSWEVQSALGSLYEDRLAGNDRYSTAVTVAQYGTGTAGLSWNRVAIATGANFPDALSGGALQGAGDSVMLLTPPSGLDAGVAAVLSSNKASITEVRFLGGLVALPQSVRNAVVNALM